MLCELNQTMMPLAPTPIAAVPSKPKIGFSIDSIVGGGKTHHLISKHHPNTSETSDLNSPPSSPTSSIHSHRYNANTENNRTTSHSPNRSSPESVQHRLRHNSGSSNLSLSPNSSPTPNGHQNGNTHIIRPSVVNPGSVLGGGFNNEGIKGLYLPEQLVHPSHHHHHHQLALAAAHFQAAGLAAALNHGAGGGGGGGFPGGAAMPGGGQGGGHMPQHHPSHGTVPRDSYPLYPWLLSRHGRIFPHRFPAGPDIPGFLLQPFRKPKRIRTAFSPSQLLKLEHAFEKNHYVVGAERKQLAQALSLTETQVKVWFQNRRTKHKRMQQEEEAKAQQQAAASNKNNHHVSKWKQETQTSTNGTDAAATDKTTIQTQYNDIEVDVDSCSSGEET